MTRCKLPWRAPILSELHFAAAELKAVSNLSTKKTRLFSYGRPLVEGGRPRNFDDATALRMMAALEPFVLERQAKKGRRLYREDRELLKFVLKLVESEGLESSPNILIKQIISPVLRKLRQPQKMTKTVSVKK
jgi:hypothetical protein